LNSIETKKIRVGDIDVGYKISGGGSPKYLYIDVGYKISGGGSPKYLAPGLFKSKLEDTQ